MGSVESFQPLTSWDKITVVLYRSGIVLSAMIAAVSAYLLISGKPIEEPGRLFNMLFYALYFSVGISVFFIHLYVRKFHRFLKIVYIVSLISLGLLYSKGNGDILLALTLRPAFYILLIPISGCLGFITAKEAFCFRLTEGYVLAMFMPLYLLMASTGIASANRISYGFLVIAILLLIFTIRKVFMPIHYDIGDKSAYS